MQLSYRRIRRYLVLPLKAAEKHVTSSHVRFTNPGWSIDVLLVADLVMEYIGKNNVSVDQVELSLVNGCLGINGILVERVALLPGINVKVTSKAEDLEDRILAREETI